MKPEITTITTTGRMQINPGQQVELTHRQAAERLPRLRDLGRHGRDRGLYEVVEAIEFKAGETLGITGITRQQSQIAASDQLAAKAAGRKAPKKAGQKAPASGTAAGDISDSAGDDAESAAEEAEADAE